MKKPTTLLGVTILTPALVAGEAHAIAPRISAVGTIPHAAALARLKAGMLALDPAAKLELAADRLPATSDNTSTTTTQMVTHQTITNGCHTQHNDVHNNTITQTCAHTLANPSARAPSGTPGASAAQQTHGALTQAPQGLTKGAPPPQQ